MWSHVTRATTCPSQEGTVTPAVHICVGPALAVCFHMRTDSPKYYINLQNTCGWPQFFDIWMRHERNLFHRKCIAASRNCSQPNFSAQKCTAGSRRVQMWCTKRAKREQTAQLAHYDWLTMHRPFFLQHLTYRAKPIIKENSVNVLTDSTDCASWFRVSWWKRIEKMQYLQSSRQNSACVAYTCKHLLYPRFLDYTECICYFQWYFWYLN